MDFNQKARKAIDNDRIILKKFIYLCLRQVYGFFSLSFILDIWPFWSLVIIERQIDVSFFKRLTSYWWYICQNIVKVDCGATWTMLWSSVTAFHWITCNKHPPIITWITVKARLRPPAEGLIVILDLMYEDLTQQLFCKWWKWQWQSKLLTIQTKRLLIDHRFQCFFFWVTGDEILSLRDLI